MDSFHLVSGDHLLRFQELASGAYALDVELPGGAILPPHILTSREAEALARHLEGTGLWHREPWTDRGP